MDFECSYLDFATDDNALAARAYLWVIKAVIIDKKLDFDTKLSNRLQLLDTVLDEVMFDINFLIEAAVLTKNNFSHRRSLCSLLLWLFNYMDCRPSILALHRQYLESLVSKLIQQLKIYPTVFAACYYKNSLATTTYVSIKFSRFQSHRLTHILDFDTTIESHLQTQGTY